MIGKCIVGQKKTEKIKKSTTKKFATSPLLHFFVCPPPPQKANKDEKIGKRKDISRYQKNRDLPLLLLHFQGGLRGPLPFVKRDLSRLCKISCIPSRVYTISLIVTTLMLLLDGNSEHDARSFKRKIRFMTTLDLIKCLEQIKQIASYVHEHLFLSNHLM